MSSRTATRRPKRAAEDYVRAQFHDSAELSSKKQRFDARNPSTLPADAPEDDAIFDLDEIGKGPQIKRNAVELDGYGSDSSTENFDSRAQARADTTINGKKAQEHSKDQEPNDMFADLDEVFAGGNEDEDLARLGKKMKKEVRFMNENEIVGQVSDSKGGGHVHAGLSRHGQMPGRGIEADSSSDESVDDGERDKVGDEVDEELGAGSKKKHAPKLEAFNMKNEAEEGKFDCSGNFVRKAMDPQAVHDAWLEGSTKADMKRARDAHEKREEQRRKREKTDDSVSVTDVLSALILRLDNGETVLEALARRGPSRSKRQPKKKRNNNQGMEVDDELVFEDPAETRRREIVEAITAAADHLFTRGQTDIYEEERGALIRQYRKETGEDWVDQLREVDHGNDAEAVRHWEYRWSDARDGGENHGPYDGEIMSAWKVAGYFGEGVEFKQVGTGEWSPSVHFL